MTNTPQIHAELKRQFEVSGGEPDFQLTNKPARSKIAGRGKETQGSLFGRSGLPGQMNLFDDVGVPDDLVAAERTGEGRGS